jgi:hypothetical protein
MIWIGNSVSPQVLLDLFGVDDVDKVDPRTVRLSFLRFNKHFELNLRSTVCPPRTG